MEEWSATDFTVNIVGINVFIIFFGDDLLVSFLDIALTDVLLSILLRPESACLILKLPQLFLALTATVHAVNKNGLNSDERTAWEETRSPTSSISSPSRCDCPGV
jgi:hypothetical protein